MRKLTHLMMWKIHVFLALHERLAEWNWYKKEHDDEEDASGDNSKSLRSGSEQVVRCEIDDERIASCFVYIFFLSFLLISMPAMLAFRNISLRFGIRLLARKKAHVENTMLTVSGISIFAEFHKFLLSCRYEKFSKIC